MKGKILLVLLAVVVPLAVTEAFLRIINYPPELNREFQRKDIRWTIANVSLDSFGYRDREYALDKPKNTFRIYTIGDSYTYGWLIDDPNGSYPKILEASLSKDLEKNVEVINAGSPGFTIRDETARFVNEGKFFSPDLVLFGINDDEANVSNFFSRPVDINWPGFIKNLHIYQASLGNFFLRQANKKYTQHILDIYRDPNSQDWKDFVDYILKIRDEAKKVNASLALVLFPHIDPGNPNAAYDFYEFDQKFKEMGKQYGIYIIDPLDAFKAYPDKSKLVINPLDPHPTVEMNKIVANAILKQFDFKKYLSEHVEYEPVKKTVVISKNNSDVGPFQRINSISSNVSGYPWVYFETKNGDDVQEFPLIGMQYRKTAFHADYLQTAKAFTHSGLPGAIMTYYTRPEEKGIIQIDQNLYGYDVVGASYILAMRIMDNGTTKGDYIVPTQIEKSGDKWLIKFDQKEDYQLYELNLKVAVRQMDIDPEGKVTALSATSKLSTTLDQDTDKITFTPDYKIFSWARFEDFSGGGFDYAYVDDKMTPLKAINLKDNGLTLTFNKSLHKGQTVSVYVSSEHNLSPGEAIKLDIQK